MLSLQSFIWHSMLYFNLQFLAYDSFHSCTTAKVPLLLSMLIHLDVFVGYSLKVIITVMNHDPNVHCLLEVILL